jgi:hypothetical protein
LGSLKGVNTDTDLGIPGWHRGRIPDARLPDGGRAAVVGDVNDGWAVALCQLFHECNAVGGGSPYFSGAAETIRRDSLVGDLIDLVREPGGVSNPAYHGYLDLGLGYLPFGPP